MTDDERQRVYDGASALKPKPSTVTMKVGDHQFQKINPDELNAGKEALRIVQSLQREVTQLRHNYDQAQARIRQLQDAVRKLQALGKTPYGNPYKDGY